MSPESRRLAGILLVIMPAVLYGGVTLLWLLTRDPTYATNELRQDLWRAGHAHAGVLLLLSLIILRYVDQATLPPSAKWIARHGAPLAAIALPLAFFLSMPTPASTEPNAIIYLAYLGAAWLAVSLVILGIGLLRR